MPQILIVDDEVEVLGLIQEALKARGLVVKAAQNDQQAFALLEEEAGRTAVLITDVNLGAGVTGFDIARKARTLNPALTVVYITGDPEPVQRFGVADALIVPKPFSPEEIAQKVATIVNSGDTQ